MNDNLEEFADSNVEFGDRVEIKVEGLKDLVEALNKFEILTREILEQLQLNFTPEEMLLGFLALVLTIGFTFKMGSRLAEFVTWIPIGIISLIRPKRKEG